MPGPIHGFANFAGAPRQKLQRFSADPRPAGSNALAAKRRET